ncbi:MAG: 4-hydroxy-3-methylbut-2-enyl diphosphate reductase, partial [Actinomycetota bacterium]|nr:4-hydroxy-3-methylbut-2-enyl diphosphate reductase [Actinomycetota bacterium]
PIFFVEDVAAVPEGAPLMLSAHGSPPEVVARARASGGVVVNAVCPLVKKVHHEVKVRAGKGYTIVYVGHAGHQEAIGTMAVAPDAIHLVESPEDIDAIPEPGGPVAFLAQTTLALDEWRALLDHAEQRWPELWVPGHSDLCFATTNRQAALKAIAGRSDVVVVIGSANSSNTRALERTAVAAGCGLVLRVNGPDELPEELTGTVGVIAGASAPEALVEAVVERLSPAQGCEEVMAVDEDEYFQSPPELRDLLRNAAAVVGLAALAPEGAPVGAGVLFDDRSIDAAEALSALPS